MNRIRKYNNKYQVIITPHQKYNVGFEFLLGSWTDEGLMGFEVKEFDTYHEAECMAGNYPDINWEQLVDYHKDNYYHLKSEIKKIIDYTEMVIEYIPNLLTPEQTKNRMFDRVIKGQSTEGNSFRLISDMNDIISFVITNPWSHNLQEMEQHLLKNSSLRLFNKVDKNGIVHLIGRTDINTSYEIILVPNIIHNWMKWRVLNKNVSRDVHNSSLGSVLRTQTIIDKSPRIR